jgi:hypothetical protein
MAAEPEGDGGENEVVVNTAALRLTADVFEEVGDRFVNCLIGMKDAKVAPGNFPAAFTFKGTADTALLNYHSNVLNFGEAYRDIASRLRLIADDYDATEDDNKDDADRIDPVFEVIDARMNKQPPASPAGGGGGGGGGGGA